MSSGPDPHSSSVARLAVLGSVLEEHRPRLLEMLRRRIDRGAAPFDAEDVFQDVCVSAQRRWPEFEQRRRTDPTASAYVWLYGLANDRFIDRWRQATRRPTVPWPDRSSEQLCLHLFDHGTGPASAAVREELKERVHQALELLPDDDHEIVKLRHFDQLTFGQAGEALGITENTAAARHVRALKRLKKICEALFSAEDDV